MSRRKSIAALITKSRESMSSLKNDYQSALEAKEVSEVLKVDIKNLLENLRSCLDYIARDIHDKFISGAAGRLYFPIRHTANEFQQAISSDYSGLDQLAPDVYAIIEQVQPYNDAWLGGFNRLNNDNKHEDLVEQTRTETKRVTVSSKGGGGSVSWGQVLLLGLVFPSWVYQSTQARKCPCLTQQLTPKLKYGWISNSAITMNRYSTFWRSQSTMLNRYAIQEHL